MATRSRQAACSKWLRPLSAAPKRQKIPPPPCSSQSRSACTVTALASATTKLAKLASVRGRNKVSCRGISALPGPAILQLRRARVGDRRQPCVERKLAPQLLDIDLGLELQRNLVTRHQYRGCTFHC